MPLNVSFDVARTRLADLVRGGNLLTASQDAYGGGIAGLARVGPVGPRPGVSRLVEVRFREPVTHGDSVAVAFRWEAIGPGGELFPALDADLTLVPAGGEASLLRLAAAYRPPLLALGARLDHAMLHRVADATVREFLGRVGTAITRPVPVTGPARESGHRGRSLPPDVTVS
jgi:hypothetical protein